MRRKSACDPRENSIEQAEINTTSETVTPKTVQSGEEITQEEKSDREDISSKEKSDREDNPQ